MGEMRRSAVRAVAVVGVFAVTIAVALTNGPAFAALTNQPPTAVATASPNPAHAGQVVHLFGTSSTDPDTAAGDLLYAWSFGDGSSAVGSTANFAIDHTYALAGVYSATLTVTDPQGAFDTDKVVVEVDDTAPIAVATATPTTTVVGHLVQFDGSGSSDAETADADLTYAWDFKDAASSAVMKPAHTFQAAGTYAVVLTVTDPQGATATATVSVKVTNTAPVSTWTMSPTAPHASQLVTFTGSASTDAETPNALTYDWDFGDSTTHATTAVATHTYATTGWKTAKLKVTDPQGLTDIKSVTFLVSTNKAPVAVATSTRTNANVGQTVGFDASGSTDAETPGNQLIYSWDLGNGGSTADATGISTSYAFLAPGTYTVTLTVTDASNLSDTDTVTVTVGNQAPVANLVVTPSPAHALQSVAFDGSSSTDAETPDQLTYSWTYGDGTAATAFTAAGAHATHAYAAAGTFTVTLKVKDPEGSINTKTTSLVVAANGAPNASAHATPNPAHQGTAVSFTSTGSSDPDGDALTYHWTFPGEVPADTATAQRTFAVAGSYLVTLTVTDKYGVTDTDTVTVNITNGAPIASSHATPNPAHLGKPVSFTSTGSSDPDGDTLTYHWEFPGGATADTATAQRTFDALGSYSATLTVTDQFGVSDTDTVTVNVTNTAPVASAHATPNPVHVGKPVSFTSTGSSDPDGDTVTYHWEFPGGATADTATAQRTFGAVGSYPATLTVTDQYGATATNTVTVVVTNANPVASAHATPNPAHLNQAVSFTSTGSSDPDDDTLSYHWAFPGGATADTATAAHTFAAVGSYPVTLTVTDQYGASATNTVTVNVGNAAPVGSAHATPNPPHVGSAVSFTSTGSSDPDGDSVTYHWAFPGGATADTASAQHTFATVGSYSVTLTVTDQYGLTDTDTVTVNVTNTAPVASAHATPNPAHVGTPVSFTSTGSSDPDADTVTYHWAFPGGATADTATAERTFTTAGSQAVTLTVTDQYGSSSTQTVTVVVTNDAPVAAFTNTGGLLMVNQAVGFDGRGSTDTENSAQLTYAWNFGDGTTGTGATATHSYATGGSFRATLTTTDPQGKTGTTARVVDVARAVACQSSSVIRTTQWRSLRNAAASGGSYCDNRRGGTLGGTVRVRGTGTRIGFSFGKTTTGGAAQVYVDGILQGTVSFRTTGATSFGNRRIYTGLSAGTHTIQIKMIRGVGYVDDFLVFGAVS